MKRTILLIFTLLHLNIWALDVAAPKAPPSIPLLSIEGIDLTLYQDVATEGVTAIIRGKGDVYILPLNVGANLYSRGAKIRFLGTTSEGLLSLLSTDIDVFSDIAGRDLYLGGQGSSPDVITKKILENKRIDTKIIYRSSPEIAKLLISGRIENAILPEPLATMVLSKNSNVKRVEELKNLWIGGSIPQVGIFVQEKSLLTKGEEVDDFLEKYEKSIGDLSEKKIEVAMERFNLKVTIDEFKSSIKYMNLTFVQDRDSVNTYLDKLGIKVKDGFYAW